MLADMSNQVVKIKSKEIAACMTCPLCDKVYKEATTISECLHTFCKKCIYEKLSDEEEECCPVCNIYLGCAPLEKLRPDHNKDDLRAKVFPSKTKQGETSAAETPAVETPSVETPAVETPDVETPEVVPSVALPARRKERSLSSLVVSTPRVSTKTPMTGRRSKVATRKTVRSSGFSVEKNIKKEEEDSSEHHSDSSSSRETLTKFTQNMRLNSSTVEQRGHRDPDKETENGVEQWEGKADLWKPLNCLVEAANRSKSSKVSSEGPAEKSNLLSAPNNNTPGLKTKVKEHGQASKVQDEKKGTEPGPANALNPKKSRRNHKKKAVALGESVVSPQAILDAADTIRERKINHPVWLSLVASEDQEGNAPLPQISVGYLRIKDGNMPVSFLQKYLMKKLDLKSEDEVEIKCMGQPLLPTLQLNSLVELWLQTAAPTEKVQVAVGSSGKDFVMVLSYARKAPPP